MITLDDLYEAYFDCRRRKRNSAASLEYEMNYEVYLGDLWRRLISETWTPGVSIAFCVTSPKLREVFASPFEDRIVQHLIIREFQGAFEEAMIPGSYSCRPGKGVLKGIQKLSEDIDSHQDSWILKLDLKGFFMSIDPKILRDVVIGYLPAETEDLPWWTRLIEKIILERPEKRCIIHGSKELWKDLPAEKSLFTSGGLGIPIGNLTSQWFANLYLTDFDWWISRKVECYGRYVDDFYLIDPDKGKLLKLLEEIRTYLWTTRKVRINPKKVYLQKVSHGVTFTGYTIRPGHRVMPGERIKKGFMAATEVTSINSYTGLIRHGKSMGLRIKKYLEILESRPELSVKGAFEGLRELDFGEIPEDREVPWWTIRYKGKRYSKIFFGLRLCMK